MSNIFRVIGGNILTDSSLIKLGQSNNVQSITNEFFAPAFTPLAGYNYWRGYVDSNWSNPLNWSLYVTPTVSDGYVTCFDSLSPDCTIDVVSDCNTLLIQNGFVNTITHSNTLTVGGDITYGGTGTVISTGILILNVGCNIDTSSIVWASSYFQGTSQVFTLLSDLSVTGLLRFGGASSTVVNGLFNIYGGNAINIANASHFVSGTSTLLLNTNCTWSHNSTSTFGLNLTINADINFTALGLRYNGVGKTLTYVSGTFTGTVNLIIGSASLDTVGVVWDNITTVSGTITLLSDLRTSGQLSITLNSQNMDGAFYIYCSSFRRTTSGSFNGTCLGLIFNGTGTWSDLYAGSINIPFIINTAGTLTISGSVAKNGILQYIAGTVDTTGSTLRLTNTSTIDVNGDSSPSATTISSTGINFNNLTTTDSGTNTIVGNIRVCGTHTAGAGNFNAGITIYNSGNYVVLATTAIGSYEIIMDGLGTWSGNFAARHNIKINTASTFTISGSVGIGGNFNYVTGTVDTTTSTVVFYGGNYSIDSNGDTNPSCTTLSTTGINFYNIQTTTANNMTLTTPLRVVNNHNAGAGNFTSASVVYNSGNYTIVAATGAAYTSFTVIMDGTGTWSGVPRLNNKLTINTTGTITLSGLLRYYGPLFKHIAGTVVTTGSEIIFAANSSLDVSGIVFNDISVYGGSFTFLSTFNVGGTLFFSTGTSPYLYGSYGFNANNLLMNGNIILRMAAGVTHTVYGNMTLNGVFNGKVQLISLTNFSPVYFNVSPSAIMNNTYVNTIDIDSSGGQTVISSLSTFSRTVNWSLTPMMGNFLLMF